MKKIFKRIICFLLMFVTVGFFASCSKGETPPPTESGPSTEENGGSGGNNNDAGNEDDNDSDDDPSDEPGEDDDGDEDVEEVYVPYTSNEIMLVGSKFVTDFFKETNANLEDDDLFDDNINDSKILFINTASMLSKMTTIENLPFGYCISGKSVTLNDYTGKPNKVERFYATFTPDDVNGNASVRIRFAFSYNELDVGLNYDYYNILIQTNKAQKKVSCEISIERSVADGVDESVARYFNVKLSGLIDGGFDDVLYDCFKFDRTEKIIDNSLINYNNIDNFEQSVFNGETETYIGFVEGDNTKNAEYLLRNGSSSVSVLVKELVGSLNQGYKTIFSGKPIKSDFANLSEYLIAYVNANAEII